MKTLFALVALAGILKYGECAIVAWTIPAIGTPHGNGAVTTKMNNGLTTTDSTGITIVAATDEVLIVYTISAQTPTDVTFAISTAGVLTISAGTLSYATTSEYVLTIVATDDTFQTGTATTTVSVQDQPVFSASSLAYTIADGAAAGKTLATVTATVGTGTIAYSFTSGNTNLDFSVSSAGVITNINAMNAASLAGYQLVLQASAGSLTSTVDIWVAVTTCSSGTTAVWTGFISVFLPLVVSLLLSI